MASHTQDKHQLIYEICEETFSVLNKKLEKAQKSMADPVERLTAGGRDYVKFGLKHPKHYRVTFMTPHHPEEKEEIEESAGARTFQILMNAVAEAEDLLNERVWAAQAAVPRSSGRPNPACDSVSRVLKDLQW